MDASLANYPPSRDAAAPGAVEQSPTVYELIRDDIISGRVPANARLRVADLSRQYNTSNNPIREALQQLRGEGFVLMEPNRVARVRPIDEDFVRDIYEIEVLIEPALTRWLVRLATAEDYAALEVLQSEMEGLDFADPARHGELDREFHLRTYSRANMPQLQAMVERFWNSTQHFRREFVKETFAKNGLPFSDPQHLLLMDMIRTRDAEGARNMVYLHIRRTRLLIQARDPGVRAPARGAGAKRP